ncbi:MAG: hypothetical protein K8T90_22690 [Planctomycetes bacterium]|nr:hypothetical protein [Planctomycetota bacterium]
MRGLISLLRKEWRDIRTMTWMYAALVPLAMLVVRWYLGARYDGFVAESITSLRHMPEVFPVCVLLYAALVASDLIAGDLASRRSEPLALLPVGLVRVWTAKVTVLVGATLCMAAWAFLAQALTLGQIDGWDRVVSFAEWHPPTLADSVWGNIHLALPGAAIVGAVLLVSTLGLRGLAAVLLGAGLAAVLAVAYDFGRGESHLIAGDAMVWCVAAAIAVFAASAMAFVRGQAHTGARLRPALVASATLVGLLGVPAVGFAAAAHHVAPGARFTVVESVSASPRGPYLAVRLLNTLDPSVGGATFIVSLDDGVWRQASGDGAQPGAWTDDGLLPVTDRVVDGVMQGALIDPATGKAARVVPKTREQFNAEVRARMAASEDACYWYVQHAPGASASLWNVNCYGKKRLKTPRAVVSRVMPTVVQGDARARNLFWIVPTVDRLARLDVETGETTAVFEAAGRFDVTAIAWPDDRGVVLRRGTDISWLEFATGVEYACPKGVAPWVAIAPGSALRRCMRDGNVHGVWDPVSGAVVWEERTSESPGGEIVVPVCDGGVAIVHGNGSIRRFDASLRPVVVPAGGVK